MSPVSLNIPQQAFILFFAIFWGASANSQPRWKAFAWGATGADKPSWRRVWLSVMILNLLPLVYFPLVLRLLSGDRWTNLTAWSASTLFKIFLATLPAFAPFGFLRIWTAVVARYPMTFYGFLPTEAASELPQIWKEIGIDLTASDLSPKWWKRNFIWGAVYVLLGVVVVIVWNFLSSCG